MNASMQQKKRKNKGKEPEKINATFTPRNQREYRNKPNCKTNRNGLKSQTENRVGQHACHESQGQPEGHAIAMEGRTFLKSSYENRKKEDVLLQEVEASEHKINLS